MRDWLDMLNFFNMLNMLSVFNINVLSNMLTTTTMLNIVHGQEERLPGPGGGDKEGHGPQRSHLQRLQD